MCFQRWQPRTKFVMSTSLFQHTHTHTDVNAIWNQCQQTVHIFIICRLLKWTNLNQTLQNFQGKNYLICAYKMLHTYCAALSSSELFGALSPVNYKGLHRGWTQTSLCLQVVHFTSHHTTSHVFFFSLFIFLGHSTWVHASGRVTYFILRAYTGTMC